MSSRGGCLISHFHVHRVAPTVPPLAPAKVLRSDAAVPTRRRSSWAPRVAESTTTAASEGPRSATATVEPQQAVEAPSAAVTTTVTAPSVPPTLAPIDDSQAVVVEIPDKDVPPPGWDQWVSLPTPAPEPPTGALVVRDDGGATLGCPADGAEAPSSRAALPASGGPTVHPEQERERAGAPPTHFAEAQAE
jgi:hypothetical protein